MTLVDVLRRPVQVCGSAPAVIDGDATLDYRELGRRVQCLTAGLQSLGMTTGAKVAVLLQNGHRYLETYFAVAGGGGVLVPLNNRHAVPEHQYIIEDAGASLLICDETSAPVAAELSGAVNHVLRAPHEYEELISSAAPQGWDESIDPDALAVLFYTGGTTGRSKGVMLSHRNLVANALHTIIGLEFRAEDRYLHVAPMFHLADGSCTYAVTWVGGCHVFVPTFEPRSMLTALERDGVTATVLVPTMINTLINHPDVENTDLSTLRLVMHGGAPIATELLARAHARLGCSFTQAYGMSEAAPILTFLPKEETLIGDPRLRSAGQEVPGVEIRVARPDGSECDEGEVGEVVARGPNMLQGYWNKPAETATAVHDGWYWTGDLGYFDADRYLFIVDRAKDMIISGGENVYSAEVEDALMAHPAVLEGVAFGVPDEHWGERVHAAVVLREGATLTIEELRSFCVQRIAGYKAPRSMEVHTELPKSGAGKILKRDLRSPHWSGQERSVN